MCKHPPSFSHRLEFYDALCWFDLVPYFKYATCTIDGLWYHLTWRPCSGVTDLTWRSCSGVRMYSHFVRARLKRKVLHQVGSKILCLLIDCCWLIYHVCWLLMMSQLIVHIPIFNISCLLWSSVITCSKNSYIYISTYKLGGPPYLVFFGLVGLVNRGLREMNLLGPTSGSRRSLGARSCGPEKDAEVRPIPLNHATFSLCFVYFLLGAYETTSTNHLLI